MTYGHRSPRPERQVSLLVRFNRLPYAVQREICELMIGREVERLNRLGHNLMVEAVAVENLVREGFHRTLGARPMRNTVDRYFQERAAEHLLQTTQPRYCSDIIAGEQNRVGISSKADVWQALIFVGSRHRDIPLKIIRRYRGEWLRSNGVTVHRRSTNNKYLHNQYGTSVQLYAGLLHFTIGQKPNK